MKNTATTAALAILTALSLAACSPGDPTPGESDSPSLSPTSTETALPADGDGETPVDPNVLFTITVTATAPNGAIADLVQTVYKPVAATDQQSVDEAGLDSECEGWRDSFASAEYVVSLIDVTDRSPAGSSWDRSVAVASMNGWPVFSGEVDTFQSYCASYQVNIGASRVVSPVTAGVGADGVHGWAHMTYGFGIATNAGSDTPGPDDTLLSNCTLTLSDAAQASAVASAWVVPSSPINCSFGEYDYGV